MHPSDEKSLKTALLKGGEMTLRRNKGDILFTVMDNVCICKARFQGSAN